MAQSTKEPYPAKRLTVISSIVLLRLFSAGCEDFYTDSLPTLQIALPTPAMLQDGDPQEFAETGATAALAANLGIGAIDPRKILFEDATWTDRAPGCYPPPPDVAGPYLVPGYRLLIQHEDIFYEYYTDITGLTGALCETTLQPVPVEPALDSLTVNIAASVDPDMDTVYILRSEADVAEFNSTNSEIAAISVEVIDWTSEVLVGGWAVVPPNAEATRAYVSPIEQSASSEATSTASTVIIEVSIAEDLVIDESAVIASIPSQIWALVEITEPDSTYEFIVAE